MNKHGGSRAGSGRKQTLEFMARLHVGARAVNFQRKLAERKAFAKYNKIAELSGLREAQAKSLSILRAEGVSYWEQSSEGEEAREDIGFSLMTLHGLPDTCEPDEAPRGVRLQLSSYNTRGYACSVVSRWATWYYGVTVTPRRVRDCWIEYRSFIRES